MTVILCVDNRFGLTFNRRRVSRDSAVTADIEKTRSGRVYADEMSRAVLERAVFCENFLEQAGENDACFVENREIAPYMEKIHRIVLYRWNRDYPSDFRFNPALLEGFTRKETVEFPGTSHEKITKEVYTR